MRYEQFQTRLTRLRSLLDEAAGSLARVGTLVGWRTPGGQNYGVVLGKEGKDLICLSTFHKKLRTDKAITYYEDAELTSRLGTIRIVPNVETAVQRVPMHKAFKRGTLVGKAARPYLDASIHLNLEDVELADEELLETLNDRLLALRLELEEEGLTEGSYQWMKQKFGAAKAKAHRAFVQMVRKDPAAHRRKMKTDRRYHQKHKWHDALMRKTARAGYRRSPRRRHEEVEEHDTGNFYVCSSCGYSEMCEGQGDAERLCPRCDEQMDNLVEKMANPMKVQTLIFDKEQFSRSAAVKWAKSHGFKAGKVDEKTNTWRLRQKDPDEFGLFRTITFKPGLKAVVARE